MPYLFMHIKYSTGLNKISRILLKSYAQKMSVETCRKNLSVLYHLFMRLFQYMKHVTPALLFVEIK